MAGPAAQPFGKWAKFANRLGRNPLVVGIVLQWHLCERDLVSLPGRYAATEVEVSLHRDANEIHVLVVRWAVHRQGKLAPGIGSNHRLIAAPLPTNVGADQWMAGFVGYNARNIGGKNGVGANRRYGKRHQQAQNSRQSSSHDHSIVLEFPE